MQEEDHADNSDDELDSTHHPPSSSFAASFAPQQNFKPTPKAPSPQQPPSPSSTTSAPAALTDRFTPPNPAAHLHLSPTSPNPSWLEEALYGPAFIKHSSLSSHDPLNSTTLPPGPAAIAEVEVQMDWREHEKIYGAVRDAVKGRVRGMGPKEEDVRENEEGEVEEEEEWVKERVKLVGEGMRKRFKVLMGGQRAREDGNETTRKGDRA
ncbi:hypothetical protein BCR35DRAFT_330139 [Leucosporidium creatinivorum]|uniref:Uncharacterized protein n=1 Tax=Leucosporidium creatinivorum TaxID=106004 RepID=A0A1Y2FW97_9BASI|nr:hypothetical protein BCR35DRAFT_330139 [Leucosporidium creatinivorum]